MEIRKLLILDKNAETYLKIIEKEQFENLEIFLSKDPSVDEALFEDVDIILGRPDFTADVINKFKKLKWVQSTFAGVDKLCREDLRQDYQLTGLKEIFGPLMSEYVFSYILAIERQILELMANQIELEWQELRYRSLSGLTIGIVGMGSIGKHVAQTAHHFGMNVYGLKRTPESLPYVEKMFTMDKIELFLPELDYLVAILPQTPKTQHFLKRRHFELMKDSAHFFNVGRGSTVNQEDLILALQNNWIKGAVLDVFEEEPLPESSPLWSLPNVYITPHISATSFPEQIAKIFCDNFSKFVADEPLKHLVDFDRGY